MRMRKLRDGFDNFISVVMDIYINMGYFGDGGK